MANARPCQAGLHPWLGRPSSNPAGEILRLQGLVAVDRVFSAYTLLPAVGWEASETTSNTAYKAFLYLQEF